MEKYNGEILICNKEVLEDVRKLMPKESTLTEVMYEKLYPAEYNKPKKKFFKYVCFPKTDIFNEFFVDCDYLPMDSGEAFMLDNIAFEKFLTWLEAKLNYTTLMHVVHDGDFLYAESLVNTYKALKDREIDFEKEVVLLHHVF